MSELEILRAFYRAVEDASDNEARGYRLPAIERALEKARIKLEVVKWDDLNAFAKDALAYANLNGYVMALDDDEDDEDKEFAGWAKWVIWGLTKQGLLSPHDSKNDLYLITPAGRALVASADAPAELPPLPEGVRFNEDTGDGVYEYENEGGEWEFIARLYDDKLQIAGRWQMSISEWQAIFAHAARTKRGRCAMGMFDTIICDYPLPNPEHQNLSFQTKSLECLMDDYTITEDGRLIKHVVKYEVVPEEQRPYYGTPEWERGGISQLLGMLDAVTVGYEEVPYHGDIHMTAKVREATWVNYQVRFTEGRVSSVLFYGEETF